MGPTAHLKSLGDPFQAHRRGLVQFPSCPTALIIPPCYPEKFCILNNIFATKERKEHIDRSLYYLYFCVLPVRRRPGEGGCVLLRPIRLLVAASAALRALAGNILPINALATPRPLPLPSLRPPRLCANSGSEGFDYGCRAVLCRGPSVKNLQKALASPTIMWDVETCRVGLFFDISGKPEPTLSRLACPPSCPPSCPP